MASVRRDPSGDERQPTLVDVPRPSATNARRVRHGSPRRRVRRQATPYDVPLLPLSPSIAVAEFHSKFGLTRRPRPALGPPSLEALRVALIAEELDELVEAFQVRDLVAVADALGDLAYVIFGAAVTFGIDLDAVVSEIHRSNMTKLGEDGLPIRDESGKVRKGPHYDPPQLRPLLFGPALGTEK